MWVCTLPQGQCFVKCPFTCQSDRLSDQICQSLDRLSDHFAKHCAGEPWCPDVRRALPVVRKLVAERNGTLLEVCVGQRQDWKDQEHPFRHDPRLKLTGIPALFRWTADGPAERVGETLIWFIKPH